MRARDGATRVSVRNRAVVVDVVAGIYMLRASLWSTKKQTLSERHLCAAHDVARNKVKVRRRKDDHDDALVFFSRLLPAPRWRRATVFDNPNDEDDFNHVLARLERHRNSCRLRGIRSGTGRVNALNLRVDATSVLTAVIRSMRTRDMLFVFLSKDSPQSRRTSWPTPFLLAQTDAYFLFNLKQAR